MISQYQPLISKAYAAFNARNIDAVLEIMDAEVHWPNGWEGGYVQGHDEVKNYWIRQWKELDPNVEPIAFKEKQDGQIEVEVHQIAKDLNGNVLFDGIVKHIYTIKNGLIKNMEIEKQ